MAVKANVIDKTKKLKKLGERLQHFRKRQVIPAMDTLPMSMDLAGHNMVNMRQAQTLHLQNLQRF